MNELKTMFADREMIVIEAEAAPTEQARKRIAFYQRAGARLTGIRLHLYHVDYAVLVLDLAASLDAVSYTHLDVYKRQGQRR